MQKNVCAIAAMTALVQGTLAFMPLHLRATVRSSTSSSFMSNGDESTSWWGQAGSFNDEQVQTYVTPRRSKHGALYDGADSIIDLSRWDDGTYVYDEPSYRSSTGSDSSSRERSHDTYASFSQPSDRSYNNQYAYADDPRTYQSYSGYGNRQSEFYDESSDYGKNYYEEPYFASGYSGENSRNRFEYDDGHYNSRQYSNQNRQRSGNNDESSSWWGQSAVVNENQVQTYVGSSDYYQTDARPVTESNSWWSQGNVYNEQQVQTYTRPSAGQYYEPMRDYYRDEQREPQYYY
ncbi:hypothetical protein MPSEU_000783700 [Mayamaea pseudoterrestris]|nr:hypothetical protein MPSEU_000783700 [Mayamaea pseudoterrestris]